MGISEACTIRYNKLITTTLFIAALAVRVIMWMLNVLLVFALYWDCHALNCKSDGGLKPEELRNIYRNCLKKQESKNITTSRGYDDDWKDSRSRSKSPWDQNSRFGNDRSDDRWDRNREDRRYNDRKDDRTSRDDKMTSRDDEGYEFRMTRSDKVNYDDRTDRVGSSMGHGMERSGSSSMGYGETDRMGSSSSMGYSGLERGRNEGYGRSQVSSRDDFQRSDEDGSDPYNYRTSTSSPRRYKRSKGSMNSGQRSQYNPNQSTQRNYDDSYRNSEERNEKNSSENSNKREDTKACALHCFLENMDMTGDNGMPDRYLVTHAITKDVKNEDLRDFLQESIEECFQILDNEHTDDKCEFSKNLLVCLSEKGRANCDDWKEDVSF